VGASTPPYEDGRQKNDLGELSNWRDGELNRLRLSDNELRKERKQKKPLAKLGNMTKLAKLNDEKQSMQNWIPSFARMIDVWTRSSQLATRNSRLIDLENEKNKKRAWPVGPLAARQSRSS